MARGSAYKPETPRPGTEKETNDLNIQNIFAILNRMQDQINSLEESHNNFTGSTFPTAIEEMKTWATMFMDVE